MLYILLSPDRTKPYINKAHALRESSLRLPLPLQEIFYKNDENLTCVTFEIMYFRARYYYNHFSMTQAITYFCTANRNAFRREMSRRLSIVRRTVRRECVMK